MTTMTRRILILCLMIALGAFASLPSQVWAQQETPEEMMQRLQTMMNDPAFQEQMRRTGEIMRQQGLEVPKELQPGYLDGFVDYNNCVGDGLGQNWMSAMMQRMGPYIQHVEGLCQQGRQQAAAAFINDPRNAERLFSRPELSVLKQCEARFPDQAVLNTGNSTPITGAEACAAW